VPGLKRRRCVIATLGGSGFTARSLVLQKILVERFNGKKCDERSLSRDKATGYVTNTGAACAESAEV
jgi:hypothetical protein